jgi:hypothetical protein
MKAVAHDIFHLVKSTISIDASGYCILSSSETASAAFICPEPIEAAMMRILLLFMLSSVKLKNSAK